ncbi:MAG: FIST C-terminal domain-containing protein [Spirochaetaceae bacterium]|nr:FIST C-terminal domain-containing protein [Spirochaetaceae bacterium]
MLKCASVYTCEIDDAATAFEEISAQLDEKIVLLKNSVGILMCHPEFVASGVVKHICEKLPFDLAGITTAAQAVNEKADDLILTIFVMTADDVCFKTGVTGGLEENLDDPIKTAVDEVNTGMSKPPSLAIIFSPLIFKYSGDLFVSAVQKSIPNVPIFGAIATDDTLTFDLTETIYKGENSKTTMPFILCYGNINPRFVVGTFPEDKIMPNKGEITKSNGAIVSEINNINAYKYFQNIGILENGSTLTEILNLVPFELYQEKRADYDGIPVIRGIASFTEDGAAIFRGDVDEGSTFTLLISDADNVLLATRQKIEQLNDLSDVNGALLFSCIGRRMMTIRSNPLMELETVRNTIQAGIPFSMGYASGEISPTRVKNGIPTNRFHNYSLVILVV